MKTKIPYVVILFLYLSVGCKPKHHEHFSRYIPGEKELRSFEKSMHALAGELNIPSLSFAILNDKQVIYSKGIGFSDTEKKHQADENTIYPIGDLAEMFAGTLTVKLQEEEKLDTRKYVWDYGNDAAVLKGVTLKQLLSHTSGQEAYARFEYNPQRFEALDGVFKATSGKNFAQLLKKNITRKLGMKQTGENESKEHAGAFGGCVSSVADLEKFSMAIDGKQLFTNEASHELLFRPMYFGNGERSPMSLGWFVEFYKDRKFAWSFGQDKGLSAFMLKSLSDSLTLIVLANSGNLNAPFRLQDGDVLASPVAVEFIKTFVFHKDTIPSFDLSSSLEVLRDNLEKTKRSDHFDLLVNEFKSFIRMKSYMGQREQTDKLSSLYREVFPVDIPWNGLENEPMAMIKDVGNYANLTKPFVVKKDTLVQVYAVGEFSKEPPEPNPWEFDNIELYFDMNHTKKNTFSISDGNAQYRFNYDNKDLSGNYTSAENIAFMQADPSPTSYLFEIKIPWKTLGKIKPADNVRIGLEASVSDKDKDTRHGALAWHSKNGQTPWSNASVMGTMMLTSKPQGNVSDSLCYSLKAKSPIMIDGKVESGWNAATRYPLKNVYIGYIRDSKDLSATFRSEWDDNYLYFLIEVTDDVKFELPITRDFGWIENAKNDTLWMMSQQNSEWAGGALSNRYVHTSVPLKAGRYSLHYSTNQTNSFGNWIRKRPETSFYGIVVY